jgi:hypothetical protein
VAGNVTEVDRGEAVLGIEEMLDPPENEVGGPVATPPIAPTVNNAFVVTIDPEVGLGLVGIGPQQGMDKELEADGLCPANVALSIECPPPRL